MDTNNNENKTLSNISPQRQQELEHVKLELEFELKLEKAKITAALIRQTMLFITVVIGLLGICYTIYECVTVIAGKETALALSMLADITVTHTLSVAANFILLFLWLRLKRVNKSIIERLSPHKTREEQQYDISRSSSRLNPKGQTSEGDKF